MQPLNSDNGDDMSLKPDPESLNPQSAEKPRRTHLRRKAMSMQLIAISWKGLGGASTKVARRQAPSEVQILSYREGELE